MTSAPDQRASGANRAKDAAGHMLAAGAREAGRIATALAEFDQALASLMTDARKTGGPPSHGRLAAILQGIDLVRQEAEGLALLLQALADDLAHERPPSGTAIAVALTLAAQRQRLLPEVEGHSGMALTP